jgi:hypothetical protein
MWQNIMPKRKRGLAIGSTFVKYPTGRGLCVIFSYSQPTIENKQVLEKIRSVCNRLGIDLQEENIASKCSLLEAHRRVQRLLESWNYKYLLKVILAQGGVDNWNENFFVTEQEEYVNLNRDFLSQYLASALPQISNLPDVTLLQLEPLLKPPPFREEREYTLCSVLSHVDKALWSCLYSKGDCLGDEGGRFIHQACNILLDYPDFVLTQWVHAVNFAFSKREVPRSTRFQTTLRAPVLIKESE